MPAKIMCIPGNHHSPLYNLPSQAQTVHMPGQVRLHAGSVEIQSARRVLYQYCQLTTVTM